MVSRCDRPQYKAYVHTALFKVDNQQGPTVEHSELCSVLTPLMYQPTWEKNLEKPNTTTDTSICITESLCCTPENITLLINSAAAKSLQSCPTLCDPIDSSPTGSSRPWDSQLYFKIKSLKKLTYMYRKGM